jgi:hypothetical protein
MFGGVGTSTSDLRTPDIRNSIFDMMEEGRLEAYGISVSSRNQLHHGVAPTLSFTSLLRVANC